MIKRLILKEHIDVKKTLSVCIITKNEENNISRCINSIKSIADEIIVTDTGSQDNTIALATSLGATVYETIWNDSFAEAKNFALEHCTKDWILILDADETLESTHNISHKEFIQITPFEALYLNLINWIGLESINALRIPHEYNLLTTVISINDNSSNIYDVFKSIHEISSYVYFKDNNSINSTLLELGGEMIPPNIITKNQIIKFIKPLTPTKWLLFLDNSQAFSSVQCSDLIDIFKNNQYEKLDKLKYSIFQL